MKLKQFARECGVTIHRSPPGWGGKYGYSTKDNPLCSIEGFKTHKDAIDHWIGSTFGHHVGQVLGRIIG
jgi:hypothetical protein